MKITTLKQAVKHIELADDKKQQIIRELKKGRRTNRIHGSVLRVAVVFAVCVIAVAILSVPVRALVSSLVRERMEKVSKTEIETIADQFTMQYVDGDGYTRPYTATEKARMEELYEQYQNGTFPAGEIPQVDSEEEAKAQEFCFLTTTSIFYLPADRELTDEEILQKIDFEHKRNYALRERYEKEHAEEIANQKAAEKEQIAQAVQAGGVTEEQAIVIAEDYLQKIYGIDGTSLELNHYYDANAAQVVVGQPAYCVNWSDMVNSKYFDFWVSIEDGSLLGVSQSGDTLRQQLENARPAVNEAPDKIGQVKRQAEHFLTDKMGIQESYERVRSCYQATSEGRVSTWVDVLFVKADGKAYLIACGWDGTVNSYSVTTEEDYEDQRELMREVMTKRYTEEYGREVTVEDVWN